MTLAKLVDSLAEDRVLVHGSLPPDGRDLDLLARPRDERAIHHGLAGEGFVRHGDLVARFRNSSVELVEVIPAVHWHLPSAEEASLFADAIPLEGFRKLVRPAPHHVVLALARRIVEGRGALDEKRRAYVDRAVAEDPEAWRRARKHADEWGGPEYLVLLETAYATREPLPITDRAAAMIERQVRVGASPRRAQLNVWRYLSRNRARRGHVVTLSGIDGAGKSTQARALRDTLDVLGYDARVEWNKLAANGWLWRFRPVAARALLLLVGARPIAQKPTAAADSGVPRAAGAVEPDAATRLREGNAFLTHGWVTLVALANVISHRRAVARHVARGRVVICDRYVLDSTVHLRTRFGDSRRWRFESGLIRLLSPTPLRGYFLDLPAAVAQWRKEEDELDWLAALSERYREEYARLGARRIDAGRPPDQVHAELAADVWAALRSR